MAAYNLHAPAPFILKSFASALKNGEQKHLQLYCLLIIQELQLLHIKITLVIDS